MVIATRVADVPPSTPRGHGGIQSVNVSPQQAASIPIPPRDGWDVIPAAPAPSGGGGGGGGGGGVHAATPAQTMQDYITSAFPYIQQQNENQRLLEQYDAGTLQQQQATQAMQGQEESSLHQQLADMGLNSAGDLASRGLLRSGANFQAQDKINQYGVGQENSIAQQLTDLLNSRGQGRLSQQQQNDAALNAVMQQLAAQFNSTNQVA